MKRKPQVADERAVPEKLLELARKACEPDQLKVPVKCVVCGSPTAPSSLEGLCWVCRRLKISAWRENDQQIPAQE